MSNEHFSQDELHEHLQAAARLFQRHMRSGDEAMMAYWLNRYHEIWDDLEAAGAGLEIPLPWTDTAYPARRSHEMEYIKGFMERNQHFNPKCWPVSTMRWSAHSGFDTTGVREGDPNHGFSFRFALWLSSTNPKERSNAGRA